MLSTSAVTPTLADQTLELARVRSKHRVWSQELRPARQLRKGDETVGIDDQAVLARSQLQHLFNKRRDGWGSAETWAEDH